MSKLLTLIEDEPELAETVVHFFEKNGYKVNAFGSVEEYLQKSNETAPSVYLVDWRLPGQPGIELVKNLRQKDKLSSIFMVSGNHEHKDILEGLSAGADDYVAKPFDFKELLSRVNNASSKISSIKEELGHENFKLLDEANTIIKNGKAIPLTKREFLIFKYLFNHQDEVSTRETILSQFGDDESITIRNIDVHVFSLRKKISAYQIHIQTVWGQGYQLRF